MDDKFNGIPTSIIHFDAEGIVTDVEDYTLDKIDTNSWALERLAASLLPVIREFYTHGENVRAFETWLRDWENNPQKHVKRKCAQRRKLEM